MKQKFIDTLSQVQREGVQKVISNLERLGFFEAPASTRFHLARRGGLLEHVVGVCDVALALRDIIIARRPELAQKLPVDSVIVVALLHDVCKAEVYVESSRNVKNPITRQWETVPCYEVDYSHFPCGHGQKSVIRLLKWGFDLTEDEILAINWHMGAWDMPFQSAEEKSNLTAAQDKCPLLSLLQAADGLSSHVVEE